MHCPQCGASMRKRDRYCPRCGTEISAETKGEKRNAAGRRSFIPLIALVLVIAAVTALRLGGNTQPTETPAEQLVAESYLRYAASGSVAEIQSLIHPAVLEQAISRYGKSEALARIDTTGDRYGTAVASYALEQDVSRPVALTLFNETYSLSASAYREVRYTLTDQDGNQTGIDLELVQVDDAWYLVSVR